MDQICGNCRWHYAHEEAVEKVGFKNCLALPYPEVLEFFSTPPSNCTFPLLFAPVLPPITGVLHLKL